MRPARAAPNLAAKLPQIQMTTLALIIVALLLPLLVILWFTETTPQRVNRLRSNGWSQNRIAQHMGISRYKVRMVLA
jgi:hypothetical protein